MVTVMGANTADSGTARDTSQTLLHLDMSAQRSREREEACRARLATLDETDHEGRTAVLVALAMAQVHSDPGGARRTADEALQQAALAGTPAAQLYEVIARYALDLSPESLPQRIALAERADELLAQVTDESALAELRPLTYFVCVATAMEAGDMRRVDEALSPEFRINDVFTPMLTDRFAEWFRCVRATMGGHADLAEQLAESGYERASAIADVDAYRVFFGQLSVIRWMQGRLFEMEPVFLQARQADPSEPLWTAVLATIWASQGRIQASRGLLTTLPPLAQSERNRNWLAAVAFTAQAIASVGTPEQCAELVSLLEPFADRIVQVGIGVVFFGTVARPLALLMQRLDKAAEAERYYQQAIDLSARIGAGPWLAEAQAELAALLLESGRVHDAYELVHESLRTAEHLGLRSIEQYSSSVLRAVTMAQRTPTLVPITAHTPRDTLHGGGQPADEPRPVIPAPYRPVDPDAGLVSEAGAGQSSRDADRGAVDAGPVNGAIHQSADGAIARAAPGLTPLTRRSPAPEPVQPLEQPVIRVLGAVEMVALDGRPIQWTSRKAETVLSILVARRGTPIAKESVMDMLWPGEDSSILNNRLAVAIATVRRSLDPQRIKPSDEYVVTDRSTVSLRVDRMEIDVDRFLTLVTRAHAAASEASENPSHAIAQLREAIGAFTGDPFPGDYYAVWAERLRSDVHLEYFRAAHTLANILAAEGEHFDRVALYREVLARDPFDISAHDGLIDALSHLGASRQIAAAEKERQRRVDELGLDVHSA